MTVKRFEFKILFENTPQSAERAVEGGVGATSEIYSGQCQTETRLHKNMKGQHELHGSIYTQEGVEGKASKKTNPCWLSKGSNSKRTTSGAPIQFETCRGRNN
eukprot:TRINITY_DN6796_c0_g1_i1.p1 TRINITY_DN6796_c0_g1~~TRINITY_DN6796_c0_g1_i1.p1  ORF type:complete len:103 (-),score=5.18 TRINITY_DN6796_c0_g1_i1:214-522(-)